MNKTENITDKAVRVYLSKEDLQSFGMNDVPKTVIKSLIKKGATKSSSEQRLSSLEDKIDKLTALTIDFYKLGVSVLGAQQYDTEKIKYKEENNLSISNEESDRLKMSISKVETLNKLISDIGIENGNNFLLATEVK